MMTNVLRGGGNIVEFEDVGISYGAEKENRRAVFSDLSFDLKYGSRLALLGPNGSGKSTILRAILGRRLSITGRIHVDVGGDQLGYAPQDYRKALFPWLSVKSNISLYHENGRFSESYFRYALSEFRLTLKEKEPVIRLSGGEQQLLLLSLLLSRDSMLLLLDEPFSAIDLNRRGLAIELLKKRADETKATVILITHDMEDAASITERALILTGDETQDARFVSKEFAPDYHKSIRDVFHV